LGLFKLTTTSDNVYYVVLSGTFILNLAYMMEITTFLASL